MNNQRTRALRRAAIYAVIFLPLHLFAIRLVHNNSPALVSLSTGVLEDFPLQDLHGKTTQLEQLVEGKKVTLIQFWATWCGICRSELAHSAVLNTKYREDGFQVLTVSIDVNRQKLLEYVEQSKLSLPIFVDEGRSLSTALKLKGVPVGVVIDSKRNILQVISGPSGKLNDKVESWLEKVEESRE